MDNALMESILTYGFAGIAAVAAVAFVCSKQPIHAALSFAVTVLSGSGLYLLQKAPFTAAATVIVYAGATIIIFLFVLMFAQRSQLQVYDIRRMNPWRSIIAVAAFVGVLVYAGIAKLDRWQPVASAANVAEATKPSPANPASDGSASDATADSASSESTAPPTPRVADLGRVMYTQYLWSIELAGTLLLVAALGALQIAKPSASGNDPSGSQPS